MSEKQQGTAAGTREKMLSRYGDGLHHKHNKNHISYRKHYRSHPTKTLNGMDNENIQASSGLMRELRLRKIRKRLDKGRYH
ncbi:hypothetical protein [Legionella spiritensis]|uniref:Uncharacterized protein n=1 Tax=Legionella spiritensis TaxID=452 RepID=A0A0W0ZB32_LEGSP|nr:hypothetical protein [Legionella spiritensis]KTD66363.1 hypothetical protein Lspi_0126 [Legionella spiritensis]SNV48812.1 Uncharacterised protein [Legionella spiritensis]VEG91575.1 Uncharacterised protein [Legionella spiritensis]